MSANETSHFKGGGGGTKNEDVWQQRAEENIFTQR